jgi:hypothetical protein
LLWAREVRKAFDQKLHEVAGEARELLNEIPKLPAIGAASALVAGSATIRSQLAEFLDREDFYKVASDIRHRVQDLHLLVGNAAADLSKQFSAHLDQERNAIRNLAAWHTLPEGDRATFSHDLDELAYEEAKNLDGIRQLVNHRLEVDNQLGLIRQQVEARVKEIQLAASMTGAYALNETPGQPTATVVKVRRHYATASEVKPVVEKLQQAVNENRPVTFDLEP